MTSAAGAAAALLAVLVLAVPARAGEPADSSGAAAGHVIGRVEILRRDVFDPQLGSRLGGAERLANRLHVRTRPGTIRSQLLFQPGDRWSEARARETARILRGLNYLDPLRVDAHLEGDSAVVVVETRDLWTMTPRFNIASADGRHVGAIGLSDRNLLGYGKSLAFLYRDDENGISRHIAYDDPSVGGGRHQFHYAAGRGTEGALDEIALGLPFYAERAVRAYSGGWSRATFVTHLFANGVEQANFNERSERVDFWIGGRLPGGENVRRVVGSFELWDRRLGPSHLAPGAPPGFAGGEENIRIRRLAVEVEERRQNFVEGRNINRFSRIEDFDLSARLALKAGLSPRALGSSENEGYVRVQGSLGADTRLGLGWLRASGSSRLAPKPVERISQLDARWYVRLLPAHLLALGASGVAGENTPRDFQARAGGLNGLRAFPIDAVVGQRLWRLNAEERWGFSPANWEFIKFGSAVFFDAARAWGTGAEGTGWFRDAGVGLRLGIPSWGLTEVVRVDLAWPIEPTRDGSRRPVLTLGSSQAF